MLECIEFSWEFGDRTQVQNGLASAAVILTDLEELATAATLLGGGTHTSIATNDIAEYDPRWNLGAARERLRAGLGDDTYDSAWRRGVEMPTEDFIEFALAELRRVRADLRSEPDSGE